MRLATALTRASARRPWRVLAAWTLAVAVAAAIIALVPVTMGTTAGSSDSESARAAELAEQLGGESHEAVVVASDSFSAGSAEFQEKLGAVRQRLRELGARLIPGTPLSPGGHAALVVFEVEDATVDEVLAVVDELDAAEGFDVAAFGPHFVNHDFREAAETDLRRAETFGAAAALLILVLVFGSVVAALVPLALGLVATVVALGVVTLVGEAFELSVFVRNIVAVMGLALGVDYALFVLSRYREERVAGREPAEAIEAAGDTASRAVLVSGVVVAVALGSVLVVPDRLLRSLALGASVVTLLAVLAALTLLPALLGLLGDGIDRFAVPRRRSADGRPDAVWPRLARAVTRRPGLALLLTAVPLLVLAGPVVGLRLGASGASAIPDRLPAKRAFQLLEEQFGSATADPTRVVISGDAGSVEILNGAGRLQNLLARDPVFFGPTQSRETPQLTVLSFYVAGDPGGDRAIEAVSRLREELIPAARFPSSAEVLVGGPTADSLDYVESIESSRLPVIALVLGLTFVLLAASFRSVIIPLKAIALNLLSVGAAYGVLVLVFQRGYGARHLGLQQTDTIEAWVPMLLFALLFGLSMDYHVFLLSRIRERYAEGRDTVDAVTFGVLSTARIITGAALIIVVVFSALALGDLVMFQQLGVGVAIALLLDATVVRVVLVPAAMCLLGRWNWFPSRLTARADGRLPSRGRRPLDSPRAGARSRRRSVHPLRARRRLRPPGA